MVDDLTAALLRGIADYGDQRAAYERAEVNLAAVQIAQAAILEHIDALIAAVRAENACPECDGKGTVLDAPDRVLDGRAYRTTCPDCLGTGVKIERK